MNKKMIFTLVFAVAAVLLFGALTASAVPSEQWGLDCWFNNSCNITPSYCSGSYCNGGYGYGYSNTSYCQARYTKMYQAEFVTDVTYPDGSYIAPGSGFVKTWRLRNIGSAAWGNGVSLVFVSGDRMNGPLSVAIPYGVAPGQTVDISVNLVSPGTAYSGKGEWMLQSPTGERFGVGCNGNSPIWVNISSWYPTGGTACYCAGQVDCGCAPCFGSSCSPSGSRAGKNPNCNNKIRDVKDVTIPDGSAIRPGTIIRKTWRMKNGGTCVWDENYLMVFAGGDNLGGAEYTRLNLTGGNVIIGSEYKGSRFLRKVYPGDYVEISIDLKAPETAGTYKSLYKLRDGYGYEFGFGSWAAEPFWVNFTVSSNLAVSPSTSEKLPELDPVGYESESVDPSVDAAAMISKTGSATQVVATLNEPPAAVDNVCGSQKIELSKDSDSVYLARWSVENDGTKNWSGYKLVSAGMSDKLSIDSKSIAIPDTDAGETAEVSFDITVKDNTGDEPLWLEFYVADGSKNFCEFYFEIPK